MARDDKAVSLLAGHRVRVLAADETSCVADVTGEHGTYRVELEDDDGRVVATCSCPYATYHPIAADCSHVLAVRRVWSPSRAVDGVPTEG